MRRLALPLLLAALALATSARAQRGSYQVRSGDTLAEIARRHRVTVEALQEANHLSGASIRPGARLRIPGRVESGRGVPARRYRVREGDTLARIARRHRVGVQDILRANGRRNPSIRPGEWLWIPRPGHSGEEVRERTRTGNPVEVADETPELDAERLEAIRQRVRELGLGGVWVGRRRSKRRRIRAGSQRRGRPTSLRAP